MSASGVQSVQTFGQTKKKNSRKIFFLIITADCLHCFLLFCCPLMSFSVFSLQLAVDVQLPLCFGGVEGQVIFVDTEGSFVLQRVVDISAAAVRHCSMLAEDEEQIAAMGTFTVENILSNIFLVRETPTGTSS